MFKKINSLVGVLFAFQTKKCNSRRLGKVDTVGRALVEMFKNHHHR